MNELNTIMKNEDVEKRFDKLLNGNGAAYLSSVLSVVNDNKLLQNADPKTVLTAAATAASLQLPINSSLGHAWIVPYKGQAQFQLGARGFVQLAMRTGQYVRLNTVVIHKSQFKSFDSLSEELDVDMTVEPDGGVVGYAAYFKLKNGFTKTVYWTMAKMMAHGKRFSKSFANGPWKTDFDAMAQKTILKDTLRKWGPVSIELTKAIESDQSVQVEEGQYIYVDGESISQDEKNKTEEINRIIAYIQKANHMGDLSDITDDMLKDETIRIVYDQVVSEIENLEQQQS